LYKSSKTRADEVQWYNKEDKQIYADLRQPSYPGQTVTDSMVLDLSPKEGQKINCSYAIPMLIKVKTCFLECYAMSADK
jgi:hypothetical protein